MDSDRFDAITARLAAPLTRRRGMGLISMLGLSALVAGDEAAARKKKRKEKKKKRGGTCIPNCSNKTCGADGCSGTCGECFRGTCEAGVCTCATGYEVCQGACLVACSPAERRNPETCGCCIGSPSIVPCAADEQCCSGDCDGGICRGRDGLEACSFDDQCESRECRDGVCTCQGNECLGICRPACTPERATRNPRTCECCVKNEQESGCGGNSCACCCSGQCAGAPRACIGRQWGMECEFNAQCASGRCELVPAGGDFFVYRCLM